MAVTGCASLPAPPLPPETARAVTAGLLADPTPTLKLRSGDELHVVVQTDPEPVAFEATLDAQGSAHLPGSGSVKLGGLSLAQAEVRIQSLIQQRDRMATVALQLTKSDGQRATVLGAVAKQGSVAITPGMHVSQLIAASGGVLDVPDPSHGAPIPLADLEHAVLMRDGHPLPIDIGRALLGDPRHDVFVHAGDHVFVPRREAGSVVIFGQVGAPGVFPFRSGLRMTEALALAGGITTAGDKSDVRLLRGPAETPAAFSASLAAVVDGSGPDVALQRGDVLFVTDDPLEDAGEVLGILAPFATLATGGLLLALIVASH